MPHLSTFKNIDVELLWWAKALKTARDKNPMNKKFFLSTSSAFWRKRYGKYFNEEVFPLAVEITP